jgi:predicted nucleic acid-binding protein
VNVVDSSGWLEYFADGPNARFFAPPLHSSSDLLVPTLSLYEVFKRVFEQRGEDAALAAVALMQQAGAVVDLTRSIALAAARVSLELKVAMTDSVCWPRPSSRAPCFGLRMRISGTFRE